jgi:hypothetical protein
VIRIVEVPGSLIDRTYTFGDAGQAAVGEAPTGAFDHARLVR